MEFTIIKSSPYHPATNGLAERAVQVFKHGMKKMKEGTVHDKIARLLFNYRITPHTMTGISPAMLLMNRTLRTRLDTIRPSVASHVEQKQFQQKAHHDIHTHRNVHLKREKKCMYEVLVVETSGQLEVLQQREDLFPTQCNWKTELYVVDIKIISENVGIV